MRGLRGGGRGGGGSCSGGEAAAHGQRAEAAAAAEAWRRTGSKRRQLQLRRRGQKTRASGLAEPRAGEGGVSGGPGEARTILLFHTISARPPNLV